jgi:hypothetical protein
MKNLWLVLLALCVSPALAQEAAAPPAEPVPVVTPRAVPEAPAPENIPVTLQPNSGNFPPLPPSRPCARPDADGLWKLKNVFEKPRGPTSADFANNPHQYILFLRNDTYRTYKEVWGEKTPEQVKSELEITPTAGTQQFVVHESGMLFFYVDGQNIDSQACFIVANALGPYMPGDMILMPPEGRIATRLALVYERVVGEPVIKPDPDEPIKPRKRVRRTNN